MLRTKGRRIILYLTGLLISVVPVGAATVLYFPVWQAEGTATVMSGVAFCALIIAALPLWKFIKRVIRTPSVPFLWLTVFLLFFALGRIADEMTVISFVGFITNALGALLMKLAETRKNEGA